jgi:N-acetylglucosaminyl-diphospho-decaprenol L-rhamnosyltransferase
MPSLSVVIVNYRTSGLLSGLLPRLPDSANVIVVDNYSSEEERRAIEQVCEGRASLIPLSENSGFAGGVNAGVVEAREGDWILLLNPDVDLEASDVDALVVAAERYDLDVSAPAILMSEEGTIWFYGGDVVTWSGVVRHRYWARDLDEVRVAGPLLCDFISGCVMLLGPRARNLLPMRADLFMYWEDVEFSLRARREGLRLGVVSDVVVSHEGGHSSGSGRSNLLQFYQARNRLLLGRTSEVLSTWGVLLTTPIWYVGRVLRIVRHCPAGTRAERVTALTRGVLAGLKGTARDDQGAG